MLSKSTIYSYLFLFSLFPGMVIGLHYVMFTDEFICMLFFAFALLECLKEGLEAIRRHTPLFISLGIMAFYVLYSIYFVHYNSPRYIISDLISQFKPFVPFLIIRSMGLDIREKYKPVAKAFCIINAVLMIVFFVIGRGQLMLPFGHIAHLGGICLISSMCYLYCSMDDRGEVSIRDLCIGIAIITIGLLCGRSKFFGQYICFMMLLIFYRPGMFRQITFGRFLIILSVLLLMVIVAWSKIQYYFVQGVADMLQKESLEAFGDSFARPILYVTGGQILVDHFPFGSGLASFASGASADNYSSLYYEYGLDKVWGLSPEAPSFVCDAYYPTLCQFGIVGLGIFIWFWRWVLQMLAAKDSLFEEKFKLSYIIGLTLIAFVLIESIGGTNFLSPTGLSAMLILGMLTRKEVN